MDRIERIGPRTPQWQPVALDPDRDDVAQRRRREQERRRREQERAAPGPPDDTDDPPHQVDVRV